MQTKVTRKAVTTYKGKAKTNNLQLSLECLDGNTGMLPNIQVVYSQSTSIVI
jgi:hypothetical protein